MSTSTFPTASAPAFSVPTPKVVSAECVHRKEFETLLWDLMKYQREDLGVKFGFTFTTSAYLHQLYHANYSTPQGTVRKIRVMSWNVLAMLLSFDSFFIQQVVELGKRTLPDVQEQMDAIKGALSSEDPETALAELNAETKADKDVLYNENVMFDFQHRLMSIALLIIAYNPDVIALQECDFAPQLMELLLPFGFECGNITETMRDAGIKARATTAAEVDAIHSFLSRTGTTWLQKPGATGPKLEAKAVKRGDNVRTDPTCSGVDDGTFVLWNSSTMVFNANASEYKVVGDGVSLGTSTTAALHFTDINTGNTFYVVPGHLPSGSKKKSDLVKRWESVHQVVEFIKPLIDDGHRVVTLFDTNSDYQEPDMIDNAKRVSGSAIKKFGATGLLSVWEMVDPLILKTLATSRKGRSAGSDQPSKITGYLEKTLIDDVSTRGFTMTLVNLEDLRDTSSLPNAQVPSDHHPVVVDLEFAFPPAVPSPEE